MGELNVIPVVRSTDLRAYSQLLFKDLQALELMISGDIIEEGMTRIGAEQELCLIDKHSQPAPMAEQVLSAIEDPHFTTELAKFNLEINLDPLVLEQDCFSLLEKELSRLIALCRERCLVWDCAPLLTGILPTIRSRDLDLGSMMPRQRYDALNQAIQHVRNGPQQFHIQGTDELVTRHNSVMFECCNTSFQIHYQVGAKDFTSSYNWAQAIAGPMLAACTNSPMLLGKRLWRETRIALFQQATDTRSYVDELRKTQPRVIFGDRWLNKDLTELIKQDISTYRPLVIRDGLDDSIQQLQRQEIPKLKAFSLYNGTIYRWNRPCYGITDGKPHLRIENRYLPSGPTILDEVANTALWVGLMHNMEETSRKVHQNMEFHEVKTNFINAARHGLGAKVEWMGRSLDASELILKEMLPLAKAGLQKAQIDSSDSDRYLGIIEERVSSGRTGSAWILNAFNKLTKDIPEDAALIGLTSAMVQRQLGTEPGHAWADARLEEVGQGAHRYHRIDQIMSKKLYTVYEEDVIDLVPNIMKWNQIRHMLVENRSGNLVGIVTMGRLGQYYAQHQHQVPAVMVKEVMVNRVITVSPETPTIEAIKLMQKNRIGCLPVLNRHKKLVGIVTEKDILPIAVSYLSHL